MSSLPHHAGSRAGSAKGKGGQRRPGSSTAPAEPPVLVRRGRLGALEIGQRLSWLDLSDGGVRGGEMLDLTTGITWHLNAELRLFANYVFAHIADGRERGDVSIFQARIEIGI